MAFKKLPTPASSHASAAQLFLDLPRRKYSGLLDHQGQMLRMYGEQALESPDVALQLPTGSGKTLVGLLIAEWRRRKFGERVVYLCPTRQLVNQVAEEGNTKYGLEIDAFTGPVNTFDPGAKGRYLSAGRVAVTVYSHLFNANPFFKGADVIILDDAHAAENYVGKMWTVLVDRFSKKHPGLFVSLAAALRPAMDPYFHARLTAGARSPSDYGWVDKISSPALLTVAGEIRAILDEHDADPEVLFPWRQLADNLPACHVYVSVNQILIRPLIPPTWTHEPFNGGKQRIYMSATLGIGGDLERLTGRRTIKRLPIPEGWDRQGIGRRFFVFPSMSLDEKQAAALRLQLMKEAGRSLVLVPTDQMERAVADEVDAELKFPTFSAADIEVTKSNFVSSPEAVAVVANRYDGIDFPGDDCRLLFIEGLPQAVNLQERFLMSRMGALALFNDRVQTRVLQAVGRCTRGLNDYSAVVVSGGELTDYLVDKRHRRHFHPELQAEIEFGVAQSTDMSMATIVENFRVFLRHDMEWEDANKDILTVRDKSVQEALPAMQELAASVKAEIRYQESMWQGDYQQAFDHAREVLTEVKSPELKGYRALWHYLAGSAAHLAAGPSSGGFAAAARDQFARARDAAKGLPWLVGLSQYESAPPSAGDSRNASVLRQIERVERQLAALGVTHGRGYAKREREVLEGLADPASFEQAQRMLGEMLGFTAGKIEDDASPDPWWMADDRVIVFEDHAGATSPNPLIDAKKARQAASHAAWIRMHVPEAKEARVLPVLVTPATKATKGAAPSLTEVAYWPLDEFRHWAHQAMGVLRAVRTSFTAEGDLDWRVKAAEQFEQAGIDAPGLFARLEQAKAATLMEIVDAD
jgi:hypothetical protein